MLRLRDLRDLETRRPGAVVRVCRSHWSSRLTDLDYSNRNYATIFSQVHAGAHNPFVLWAPGTCK